MCSHTSATRRLGLFLLAAQFAGCTFTPTLSAPEVPDLGSKVNELRASYCAAHEREERQRYRDQRHTANVLLGLGLILGTAAASTGVAANHTDDPTKDKTLKTLAGTGAVGAAVSLVTGFVLLMTNDHDERAARAANGAVQIVELDAADKSSDEGEVEEKKKERASTLFAQCLSGDWSAPSAAGSAGAPGSPAAGAPAAGAPAANGTTQQPSAAGGK